MSSGWIGGTISALFEWLSDAPWHLSGAEPGIYLCSRHGLDEVWRHFRKFSRIQDHEGKWFYFRFWEELGQVQSREAEHWASNMFQHSSDRILLRVGERVRYLSMAEEGGPSRNDALIASGDLTRRQAFPA